MKGLNLFIAGMEKSGTTSLADWLVHNNLARYRIPGIKEPNIYAYNGNSSTPDTLYHNEIVLDASVSYAINPYALSRMPEHDTKIILCLRNNFDRTFSAYNFFRIMCRKDTASSELLKSSVEREQKNPARILEDDSEDAFFENQLKHTLAYFPAKSKETIRGYFIEQAKNIANQSFMERIQYEMGFFLSRRSFPFLSILVNSCLTFPLKNLLRKYNPEDIHLVTMDMLEDADKRQSFVSELFSGHHSIEGDLPPLPKLNTSSKNSMSEAKPDFTDSQWNIIRGWFRQDLASFYNVMKSSGTSSKYINKDHLNKNIIQT
jgi:hypothetical protein